MVFCVIYLLIMIGLRYEIIVYGIGIKDESVNDIWNETGSS